MAAPSQTSYNSSTGNGVTTVFPYTFKILQDADLQVLVDGVEQTLTTHYTVSGVGVDGGGNVTFVTAPANGTTVVRRRDMALERTGTDYQYQGEIPADVLNDDQDAPILMLQQLQEQINRAFRLPAGETMAEFDAADDRADLLPIFNTTTGVPELSDFTATQIRDMIANGYGSGALGVSGYIATLLDDANAAAARTTLGVTATGDSLFTAASAAAARSAISAAETGANSSITSTSALTSIAGLTSLNGGGVVPRGHIDGLTMSTAGSSATMTIAAGAAANSTAVVLMTLAASIAKTTSAWAVGTGNGGLDTGAIANSTWYHFYLIRRPDTGVVDVVFSTNTSAPTLPTNYTQYRLIGSGLTNGSAQWVRFVQRGDDFLWYLPVLDVSSSANPGTSAVTSSITVPTGRNVKANLNVNARNSGTGVYVGLYVSSPDVSDDVSSETAAPLANAGWSDGSAAGNRSNSNPIEVWTNTSRQIRWRINASDASVNVYIATLGWRDPRGRDA